MKKKYLVLEDGTVFEGEAFGAAAKALGELVFTTGVCGYLETLTDPAFRGQIVLQTFPLIGNYGVIPQDIEGNCTVKGYVVREWCNAPSNFRSRGEIDSFLKKQGVPGICGLDTREITRHIRDKGVMNALLCDEVPEDLSALRAYKVPCAWDGAVSFEKCTFPAAGEKKFSVTLVDYGEKRGLVSALQKRGCEVTVVPALCTAKEILASKPDGVVLSNGAGDPAENTAAIAEIKQLCGKVPLFGSGLGHQLLALALGGKCEKLKYGHRGSNQPVKDVFGSRTYVTEQNHGYAVVSSSLKKGRVIFENVNDHSCEGAEYPDIGAISVQFHPQATSGPHDTGFVFDSFCRMMGGKA